MNISESTKQKITNNVNVYIELMSEEFRLFKQSMRQKRELQKDKFSSTGKSNATERLVHEVPESLFDILKNSLSSEEWQEFTGKKGTLWFAKSFPDFRVAETI